jgi:hypothetical protein
MMEELCCEECKRPFKYGDSLYFKPIPYLEYMDGKEVTMEPYCKYCITSHSLRGDKNDRNMFYL